MEELVNPANWDALTEANRVVDPWKALDSEVVTSTREVKSTRIKQKAKEEKL